MEPLQTDSSTADVHPLFHLRMQFYLVSDCLADLEQSQRQLDKYQLFHLYPCISSAGTPRSVISGPPLCSI